MSSKQYLLCLCFILTASVGFTQNCNITVSGKITDKTTEVPLSYVNVIIQELGKGTNTVDDGTFVLNDICVGEYHLIISHIGCDPKDIHIHLTKDTLLEITLAHTPISIQGITVEGQSTPSANQSSQSISNQVIEDNSNKNLSGLLENETGVHLLKSGGGIAKPIVHGLFGNRLIILNNGVAQSGQQWGNDHSPEIDPLIANRITVIKGTNTLEYGGGNLGSMILVEPQKIGRDPHLHGRLNYAYETNGRGHNVNLQLQKYAPVLAYRINGTFKKYGDRKTVDYFLNNTGIQEANFAIQLEKSWKEKYFMDLYASTFNTELGVLRGAHIGNLTDLEEALTRTVPFFTEPDFSATIEAPKQKVSHHLIKLNSRYYINDNQSLQFILAGQLNNRKEFDVRRSGRTDIPALSLQQFTYTADLKYQKEMEKDWMIKTGTQNTFTDNTNNPETGILPLIPDYNSLRSGLFITLFKEWESSSFNFGMRYDYELQNVATISNTVPREIIRYQNHFHNISAVAGYKYEISEIQSILLNTGYAMRNPAINELYSNGLHQGVSGIEEGDINLKTEKAVKTTLEYKLQLNSMFSFESLLYYQRFNDYIFLNPQDETRLTIRGAFPVFNYEQANAEIYGLDVSSQFSLSESLIGQLKYSFIKGNNLEQNIPLVNIPPGSIYGSFTYRYNKTFNISKVEIEDLEIEWNNRFVFKQKNFLPGQDFVLPPDAYNLMGGKISLNIILPKFKIRVYTKVDNILNTKYRDYLNRQRYFADDLGISATFGANFKF